MELLTLDLNNSQLIVNKDELLTINCFNTLIEQHNKNQYKGLNLIQHLALVYWCGSIHSPGILEGKTGTDLEDNAKVTIGVDESFIFDELTNQCITEYKRIHKTASSKLCEELLKGINNITTLASKLNDMLANKIELAVDADIPVILNYQERLNDIVHKAPMQVEKLEGILKTVSQEGSSLAYSKRGDGKITNSMLPQNTSYGVSKESKDNIEEGI